MTTITLEEANRIAWDTIRKHDRELHLKSVDRELLEINMGVAWKFYEKWERRQVLHNKRLVRLLKKAP